MENVVISILATVITTLIGIIMALLLKGQSKFEARIEKHVHDLRDDIHACSSQLLVLKTVMFLQLPEEQRKKLESMPIFRERNVA